MEDWETLYQKKCVSAREALRHIPAHARVFLGHAANEPTALLEALAAGYRDMEDVELINWLSLQDGMFCAPEMAGHFRYNAMFVSPSVRGAVQEERADYTPFFFHQTPQLFSDGSLPLDAALVSVTPPDERGMVSLGTSVGGTLPACQNARLVIAQVNDRLPRTFGDGSLPVSAFDYFVEASTPLPELPEAPIGEVEDAIGRHVAGLIEDGSTIQLGIGSIPSAVLTHLRDKHDLGVHSEMLIDGIVDLVERGVITGARKSIDRGKIVGAFMLGTRKIYDFADRNPLVELRRVDYINHPATIAQNSKMVSINSCIQVDLDGQVNAESIDGRQFSGVGGQLDYVRGASLCPDGKAILAMPSTARHGAVSRIVPCFAAGTSVTTTRADVHYIVTEYGTVNLRGRSLKQRAKLLIGIAHPKFRRELAQAYEERYREPLELDN